MQIASSSRTSEMLTFCKGLLIMSDIVFLIFIIDTAIYVIYTNAVTSLYKI